MNPILAIVVILCCTILYLGAVLDARHVARARRPTDRLSHRAMARRLYGAPYVPTDEDRAAAAALRKRALRVAGEGLEHLAHVAFSRPSTPKGG